MALTKEPGSVATGTASRAVFKGLTWWWQQWHKQQWLRGHRRKEMWEAGTPREATVRHLSGRWPLLAPGKGRELVPSPGDQVVSPWESGGRGTMDSDAGG